MEEKQRIKKILKGDISEFSYFVDNYQDMAITIAYRVCDNKHDAEDIVQDSFVKAFHNIGKFRTESKFSTWFYRIVYNTAISHMKTKVYTREFTDYKEIEKEEYDWSLLNQLDITERAEAVKTALSKLPRDCSVLLTLFYLEENSIKEIVKITGLTENNIKVKLHRGRKLLAENIRNFFPDGL